jgi:non-specific serine/threonine protein kinase/serine/threonine-protein kinase
LKPTSVERWTRIQALFHSALEREPTGRESFLAGACGDDALLRVEVEALLAADDKASGFLQRDRARSDAPLEAGSSLGTYRILGLIGRGGMGEIYRARDTRLEREVAIKVLSRLTSARREDEQLKPQSAESADHRPANPVSTTSSFQSKQDEAKPLVDGDAVVALKEMLELDARTSSRFEREALLTANVQHPAVVPIYERGELPDGRPFYAMKLVSGRSLQQLINDGNTLADRMALLPNVIAIAEALAHAHWRKVVHRDVKPSNVIVGEFGETVLIDWGLAKSLTQDEEEKAPPDTAHWVSERTSVGEIIGTPAYMSPEQAKGLPVDERMDVFSLGAVLYQVLTGRPPYEGDTAKILPDVKQGHYAPLSEKQPEIPGELAAIVGKAMAPEPSQRYPTARELAEELRRFQAGQLVLSHRYSTGELVWRWGKRHRTVLLASAVFLAVAMVGGAIGLRKIVAERDRANREAEASNRVSQFMTEMFRVSDPSEARGNNITAREILEKASNQIEGALGQDPVVQACLMATMAQVYNTLGLSAKARPLAEKAVELQRKLLGVEHPDTLRSMHVLAEIEWRRGQYNAAASLLQHVVEIRRRILGPEHPETLLSMYYLAIVKNDQGQYAEAAKINRQVLDIRRRVLGPEHPDTLSSMGQVAVAEGYQGHFATAAHLDQEVLELRRRVLGAEHPFTLASMHNLGEDLRALGRYAEAEELYRQVIEGKRRVLGPDHIETLKSMTSLGAIYLVLKRFADSERIRQEAVQISRRALGPEHHRTLKSMTFLAETQSALGRNADAEKLCLEALDTERRLLGPKHPDTLFTTMTLANIWGRQGRYDESERLQLETLSCLRQTLGPSHPDVARSLYSLGALALRQGDRKKALDYLRQAMDHGLTGGDWIPMAEDDELKSLRGDPAFETLINEEKARASAQ